MHPNGIALVHNSDVKNDADLENMNLNLTITISPEQWDRLLHRLDQIGASLIKIAALGEVEQVRRIDALTAKLKSSEQKLEAAIIPLPKP
jgi:hypothetical protein